MRFLVEMAINAHLDEESPEFHMRSTAPPVFKAEVETSIRKLEALGRKSLLARGATKSVFGRTGVCQVLKAVALTDLMRLGLGTDHRTLGDWLASETEGDAGSAIYIVRNRAKKKMRESERFDNQVNAMQHLEDALQWIVSVLRRPDSDEIRPYCILCWRQPRVAGDRKYCLEHSPEREISGIRPSDFSGYAHGRRQMLRIAKALNIPGAKASGVRIDSQFCAEVFGALRRMHKKTFKHRQRRSEAIDDIHTNRDLFQDEFWPFVAGRIADLAKCYEHANEELGDISPDVDTESRDQWLERVLGENGFDNPDAFDDMARDPNHFAGIVARYNLYLLGCKLAKIAPRRGRHPPRSKRSRALRLRTKGLSFGEIGEKLGISRQRAHVLCKEGKTAPAQSDKAGHPKRKVHRAPS